MRLDCLCNTDFKTHPHRTQLLQVFTLLQITGRRYRQCSQCADAVGIQADMPGAYRKPAIPAGRRRTRVTGGRNRRTTEIQGTAGSVGFKLGPAARYLDTVRGVGYRFVEN